MQNVGEGWLILTLTNSPFYVGLTAALSSVGVLLFSLYAGVIADRVDKRRFIVFMQLAFMIEAFTVSILVWTHVVAVWQVLVLATTLGLASAFDIPMRQSFIVEMVGKDDLMNAIALNSSLFNAARVVGPAIAGLLIGAVGIAWCYFLNGVSYIAVIAGLLMMRLPNNPRPAKTTSAWSGFREALAYLRGDRKLRVLMILTATISVFGFPYIAMMPVFARDVLHRGVVDRHRGSHRRTRRRAGVVADSAPWPSDARGRHGLWPAADSFLGVAQPGALDAVVGADRLRDDREQLDYEHAAADGRAGSPARPHHGVLLVRVRGDGAVRGVSLRAGRGACRRPRDAGRRRGDRRGRRHERGVAGAIHPRRLISAAMTSAAPVNPSRSAFSTRSYCVRSCRSRP